MELLPLKEEQIMKRKFNTNFQLGNKVTNSDFSHRGFMIRDPMFRVRVIQGRAASDVCPRGLSPVVLTPAAQDTLGKREQETTLSLPKGPGVNCPGSQVRVSWSPGPTLGSQARGVRGEGGHPQGGHSGSGRSHESGWPGSEFGQGRAARPIHSPLPPISFSVIGNLQPNAWSDAVGHSSCHSSLVRTLGTELVLSPTGA